MKYQDAYEKIKELLTNGTLGSSGTRLISTQELSKRYNISFVNILKIVRQLKNNFYLVNLQKKLYIANGLAKKNCDLRKLLSNSKNIGISIPSITNPFFANLTEYFNEMLREQGYTPILYINDNSKDSELNSLNFFLNHQCVGVISFAIDFSQSTIEAFNRFPLPHIMIGKKITGLNLPTISSENYSSGFLAAKRLIETGYEYLFFIHPGKNLETNRRFLGFLEGVKSKYANLEKVQSIEYNSKNNIWKKQLSAYIDKLETNKTIGIFCYHDLIASDVYMYLTTAKFEIPKRIGIIGYDDLPISQIFNLTTFNYSYKEISKQGINVLIQLIKDSSNVQKDIQIQTLLIHRNSTLLTNENV